MIDVNVTQELRVLRVLRDAKGEWVSKRYFLRTMLLSQAGRALFNLQKGRDRYGYEGIVESSKNYKLRDEYKFVYYRLVIPKVESVKNLEARLWAASELNVVVPLPNEIIVET